MHTAFSTTDSTLRCGSSTCRTLCDWRSIHYLYRWGAGSQTQLVLSKRRGTPRTGRQSSTGLTQRDGQPFTFTLTGTLESQMNVHVCGLWEILEETHLRYCKLSLASCQAVCLRESLCGRLDPKNGRHVRTWSSLKKKLAKSWYIVTQAEKQTASV